jgi:hypothetical protein
LSLAVLAHGALAAGVAFGLVLGLSLAGFTLLPSRFRPAHARLSLPLALSVGATAAGGSGWLVGYLAGTRFLLPLLGLLLLVGLRRSREWAFALRRDVGEAFALARSRPFLALAAAAPLVLLLPQLLIPLVDSDGIRYHAALPKLYLMTGKIFLYPWDVRAALPQGGEVLFAALLGIGPDEAVKWFHAIFFAASLGVLAASVHRVTRDRSAALAAPLLLAVSPVALAPAGAAFVDHLALFHLGTAVLLVSSGAAPLAAGLALAGAVSTKLTAMPAALGLVAFVLLSRQSNPRWRAKGPLALSASLLLPSAVALGPVVVRNVVATGDPFFPAGHVLLAKPVPGLTEEWRSHSTQFHAGSSPLGLVFTEPAQGGRLDEVIGWHHLLGLVALPLAFQRKALRPFLALVLPYAAVLLFARPPTRLLLPALWGLSPFGAEALVLAARRLAPLAAAAVAAPAAAVSATLLLGLFGPADYLSGRVGREEFLSRSIPGYRAARWVNALPPGGSVMALDFPGPFYFSRPWMVEGIVDEPPLRRWLAIGEGAERLLARLREAGVRYIVVTPGYGGGTRRSLLPLARSRAEGEALLAFRSRLRLAGSVDGCDIFEVPPGPPGAL